MKNILLILSIFILLITGCTMPRTVVDDDYSNLNQESKDYSLVQIKIHEYFQDENSQSVIREGESFKVSRFELRMNNPYNELLNLDFDVQISRDGKELFKTDKTSIALMQKTKSARVYDLTSSNGKTLIVNETGYYKVKLDIYKDNTYIKSEYLDLLIDSNPDNPDCPNNMELLSGRISLHDIRTDWSESKGIGGLRYFLIYIFNDGCTELNNLQCEYSIEKDGEIVKSFKSGCDINSVSPGKYDAIGKFPPSKTWMPDNIIPLGQSLDVDGEGEYILKVVFYSNNEKLDEEQYTIIIEDNYLLDKNELGEEHSDDVESNDFDLKTENSLRGTLEIDDCNKLNYDYNKYKCYTVVAAHNDNVSICEKIPLGHVSETNKHSNDIRDGCFQGFALSNGDVDLCNSLQNESSSERCKYLVNILIKNDDVPNRKKPSDSSSISYCRISTLFACLDFSTHDNKIQFKVNNIAGQDIEQVQIHIKQCSEKTSSESIKIEGGSSAKIDASCTELPASGWFAGETEISYELSNGSKRMEEGLIILKIDSKIS